MYMLKHHYNMDPKDISREITSVSGERLDVGTVMNNISQINPEREDR